MDGLGSYTCRCLPGFNGTRCETGTIGQVTHRQGNCFGGKEKDKPNFCDFVKIFRQTQLKCTFIVVFCVSINIYTSTVVAMDFRLKLD